MIREPTSESVLPFNAIASENPYAIPLHLAGTGASTDSNLIDAMNHDAAILKQEKHITPKKLHVLNVLGVLSKYPSGATSWQLRQPTSTQ
jgi:hypothetical protein